MSTETPETKATPLNLVLLAFINQILLAVAIAFVALRPTPPLTLDTRPIERRVLVGALRSGERIIRDGFDRLTGGLTR